MSLSLRMAAADEIQVRPSSTNSLRQPGAATGWQRKGTGATASSMPRPFDAPDDVPATATTRAPWAEPVANDGAVEQAPDPAVPVNARIRHVAGSVNSPSKPLTWRLKSGERTAPTTTDGGVVLRTSGSASTTVRRTAHLQDLAPPEESVAEEESGAPEFNSPQAAEETIRTAQGTRSVVPDPAVPVPPTTEPDSEPSVDAPRNAPPDERPVPKLGPPRTAPKLTKPPREEVEPLSPVPPRTTAPPRRRDADLNLLRDVPCDRMYGPDKNRNCCAEELLCGEARKRVKQLTIDTIKVDITPTCNLAGEWSDAPETKCGWQLELSPMRPWKNRVGKQIAHGRFSGFENARVVITDESGETSRLKLYDLSEDDRCFVTAWCGLPFECGLVEEPLLARNWQPMTMTWKASALCHKPLWFEDAQLERYGHTSGPILQPFVSGAHFFTNIALLPYNMGIHPMNECQYSLGYYRPGNCAPRIIPPFPLSVRGGLMEAGAIVGGVYLFP